MKFKEFRDLIFSPCYVMVNDIRCFVETHEDTDFDDYEVIGVRATTFDYFDEAVIVDLAQHDIKEEEDTSWLNRVYTSHGDKNIQAEDRGVK